MHICTQNWEVNKLFKQDQWWNRSVWVLQGSIYVCFIQEMTLFIPWKILPGLFRILAQHWLIPVSRIWSQVSPELISSGPSSIQRHKLICMYTESLKVNTLCVHLIFILFRRFNKDPLKKSDKILKEASQHPIVCRQKFLFRFGMMKTLGGILIRKKFSFRDYDTLFTIWEPITQTVTCMVTRVLFMGRISHPSKIPRNAFLEFFGSFAL
jgi:hypothetical protein